MKISFSIFVLIFIITVIYSCDDQIVSSCDEEIKDNLPVTTFSWIQNNVFTPQCAGCHGNASPRGDLICQPEIHINY